MKTIRFHLGDGVDRLLQGRLFVSIYLEEYVEEERDPPTWLPPSRKWVGDFASVWGKKTLLSVEQSQRFQRSSEMAIELLRHSYHPRIS